MIVNVDSKLESKPNTNTRRMKLISTVAILLSTFFVNAQNFEWAKSMGGASQDRGNSISTDPSGNVYTTGLFDGTVDFDPGAGVYNIATSGGNDIFISKLDAAGNFLWAKGIGGTLNDGGYSITNDALGNVYITGTYRGTVDFDPGAGVFNLVFVGSEDMFILKLDANGDFLWAKSMGGASAVARGLSISIAPSGDVYTTGAFSGTVDFDPGAGAFSMISSANSDDIFISKLDANGNFLWAKRMGGTSIDRGGDITTDPSGNVYSTGSFNTTADFDPGAGTFNMVSSGSYDVFISKLDANGNFIWAKKMGGTSIDIGNSIAADLSGNVYSTGRFNGTADFDPGAGTFNRVSIGGQDIFISKLDANGTFIWAKTIGGTSDDVGYSIKMDPWGNVYTAGSYELTADFDPGAGSYNMTSAGISDIFISKLDTNGAFIWAKSMGGTLNEDGYSIATDAAGNVYSTGQFGGTADFDPGVNTYNLTSVDLIYDIFISKLCGPSFGTDIQTECGSYTWIDGNTYTSSNNVATYNISGGAANGCDSLVTLNLTIVNAVTGSDSQTECGSYTWIDGITYTSSNNVATYNLPGAAANGCDSIVTLNLTIVNAASGTDTRTECDSYTWIDGITYTSSNNVATYNFPGGAANGCDSLVTLNLTIGSVNVSVSNSDPTLMAATIGASYQWIDCTNGNAPIGGAVNQSFTPVANGSYAVIVSENGCTDTSVCFTVNSIGLTENYFTEQVVLYPNPTAGTLKVDLKEVVSSAQIQVLDLLGAVIQEQAFYHTNLLDLEIKGKAGMYILVLHVNSVEIGKYAVVKKD